MQYRGLGKTGLQVSRIALGTMVFGAQVSEENATKIIEFALDKGVNFIDTADIVYAEGRSEEIVGKVLQGKRDSVILATKVGFPTGQGLNDRGLSRRHIMKAIDNSLRRLKTDYVDIYYAHKPDYKTPIEETIRTMDDLVHQGKVRYIGYSNCRAWQLARALSVSEINHLNRFEILQTIYNLLMREHEYELLSFCASEGLGVCIYNPLAAGMLTGKHNISEPPAKGTRFADPAEGEEYRARYWSPENFEAISRFKEIAKKYGYSLAQFAIAWTLNNEVVTTAIVGATSIRQMEENLRAVDIKLSKEEMTACDEAWQKIRPPRFSYGR